MASLIDSTGKKFLKRSVKNFFEQTNNTANCYFFLGFAPKQNGIQAIAS